MYRVYMKLVLQEPWCKTWVRKPGCDQSSVASYSHISDNMPPYTLCYTDGCAMDYLSSWFHTTKRTVRSLLIALTCIEALSNYGTTTCTWQSHSLYLLLTQLFIHVSYSLPSHLGV
jgi:hypothetical protein